MLVNLVYFWFVRCNFLYTKIFFHKTGLGSQYEYWLAKWFYGSGILIVRAAFFERNSHCTKATFIQAKDYLSCSPTWKFYEQELFCAYTCRPTISITIQFHNGEKLLDWSWRNASCRIHLYIDCIPKVIHSQS